LLQFTGGQVAFRAPNGPLGRSDHVRGSG
jgi:hypothetical protein